MGDPAHISEITATADLLAYYSLEVDTGDTKEAVLDQWLRSYPPRWVRLALIEALYQGRYKMVSVAQLLSFWQRRGQPVYHFSADFEKLVSSNSPQDCGAATQPLGQVINPSLPLATPETGTVDSTSLGKTTTEPFSAEVQSPKAVLSHLAGTGVGQRKSTKAFELPILREKDTDQEKKFSSIPLMSRSFDPWLVKSEAEAEGGTPEPIHQFVPAPTHSEFCNRLVAIAKHQQL